MAHLLNILAALLCLLSFAHAEKLCAEYKRSTCLYGDEILTSSAKCAPVNCTFDQKEDFACGFAETGRYYYSEESSTGCDDPFMSMKRAAPSPCSRRCCSPTLKGKFTVKGRIPGTYVDAYHFTPTNLECDLETITRGQLLHYLHSLGAPLVIIGDSMMRQFFLRLVAMMRGQQRILDHHIHTHAQYHVCHQADAFRISVPSADGNPGKRDSKYMQEILPDFFNLKAGPGVPAFKEALKACARRPAEIHYLLGPLWPNQRILIPEYLDSLSPGVKPVIITSVGYWERPSTVSYKYLDMLEAVANRTSKVIVASVPTVKVPRESKTPGKPSQYEVLQTRNAFMRQWVEDQQSDKFMFFDFDAVTVAENRPPLPGGDDKHYLCSLWWRGGCSTCTPVAMDVQTNAKTAYEDAVPQFLRGTISLIHTSEDGSCTDETQRNAWQVLLNALIS